MLHKIEDQFGKVWFVGKDDPAYELVQKLHTRHYTWIVLTRLHITSGVLGTTLHTLHNLKEYLRKARRVGYNTIEGKRYLRLAECLRVLGGN